MEVVKRLNIMRDALHDLNNEHWSNETYGKIKDKYEENMKFIRDNRAKAMNDLALALNVARTHNIDIEKEKNMVINDIQMIDIAYNEVETLMCNMKLKLNIQ